MKRAAAALSLIAIALTGVAAKADDQPQFDGRVVPPLCRLGFNGSVSTATSKARAETELCMEVYDDVHERHGNPFFDRLHAAIPGCLGGWTKLIDHREAMYRVKPVLQLTKSDFAGIVEFDLACRRDEMSHGDAGFSELSEIGDGIVTIAVREVFDDVAEDRFRALAQAKIQADADARQHAADAAREANDQSNANAGYTPSSVLDLQAYGRERVGLKVAVQGWLRILDDGIGTLSSFPDNPQGLIVDFRSAHGDVRYNILSKCSNPRNICSVELRGVISESPDGDGVHLHVD